MALSRDWQIRIDNWCKALSARIATPLRDLPAALAVTDEHLSAGQARKLPFKPIAPGARWGRQWQYGWFRCAAKPPRPRPGKAVVLAGHVGDEVNEAIVFIDGVAAGGLDRWHRHVDLSAAGRRGRRVEILLESYAGHRYPTVYSQFAHPDRPLMPPAPARMQTFGGLHLAEWDESAYQLWIDADTLRRLIAALPVDSLRRHRVERAMREVTALVDLEAPAEAFAAAIPAARKHLAPLLAARNGTTAPECYCFGHAHIDVAWLWPLAQTFRKSAHTFSTALTLMDRYREYRFCQSQAQLYDYLREQYPDIYARIRRAARRGQWIADGAMWVEADTNVAGGEALIRQFLLGKRFFADEFGVDCEVCWLPDVFGYNANLPQILRGCGVKYFSTQKIYWNYHGGTTFPYETFTWEGVDGSTVLAHMHRNYNAETHPEALAGRWAACVHKDGTERLLYPFGWGDGGGGPTRDHLEYLRREADLEGLPRTRMASPREFFAALEADGPPADRWVGEMYLEVHRGTYTSQAHTKRANRKSELALREAELWSAAAAAAGKLKYPHTELEQAWKKVLLNQFHDILPGSSIGRVYDEAAELYDQAQADTDLMTASARMALLDEPEGWTVFNSLSWDRDAVVSLPASAGAVEDADGTPLPTQTVGTGKARRLLVAVPAVPAMGCATIRRTRGKPGPVAQPVKARADRGGAIMENDLLRLRINRRGEIAELLDRDASRQLVRRGEAMNRLEMYRDNPAAWDAWDIDLSYKAAPEPLGAADSVRVLAAGPLEARVAVARKIGRSTMVQHIVLRADSRRIDFETRVNWRETHRLLKVAFGADLAAPVLRGEIQFAHVIRPTHRNTEFERQRFEWPAQKWAAVSEAAYGIALLNDCKYGYDFLDGVLRLTLLRAPVAPDPQADRGEHEFTYALYAHSGPFDAGVVRAAYELNVPPAVARGGCSAGRMGLLSVSNPAVVAETVKRSEDGGATVVRLYESLGGSADARVRLSTDVRTAAECDLLENPRRKLRPARDGSVRLRFRPFEIKTIRFT